MKSIPFKTFTGFQKQLAVETLPQMEQELFDFLFPEFRGTSDSEEAYKKAKSVFVEEALSRYIQLKAGERRYRRFSGADLPRNRYFSLCLDDSGNDFQTLAHELRAYRNPVEVGMVEVLDLAQSSKVCIRDVIVPFEPQRALAVMIHEPQEIPAKFHSLVSHRLPGLKNNQILVFNFPYRVTHNTIENTIDLRFPEVREWFYNTFRVPSEICSASLAPTGKNAEISPTTAYSRFHFKNGLAPVPTDFWSMLPTLINPDLGGGNVGDTGSTLVMIGNWMRQNHVGALIFPSARCDTAVTYKDGVQNLWQGWNLVDYRESLLYGGANINLMTIVISPWAWVSLPLGVKLHVAGDSSEYQGSFAIEGMVNYWAQDYIGQLKALEIARAAHGRECPNAKRRNPSDGLNFRAFQIGILAFKWIKMMLQDDRSIEQIDDAVLELQGLAMPYNMYQITGRILDLWVGVKRETITFNEILFSLLSVINLLTEFAKRRFPNENIDRIIRTGADIELLLLFLQLKSNIETANNSTMQDFRGLLNDSDTEISTPLLDDKLTDSIRKFKELAINALTSDSINNQDCIEEGIHLQKAIYQYLRSKENNR